MNDKKKKQKLRITVQAQALFEVDELSALNEWLDDIRGYGDILNTHLEVLDA